MNFGNTSLFRRVSVILNSENYLSTKQGGIASNR